MSKENKNKKPSNKMLVIVAIAMLLLFISLYLSMLVTNKPIEEVKFGEFMAMVDEGKVASVEIGLGYAEKFTFVDTEGNVYKTDNPKSLNFKRELLDYGIEVTEVAQSSWATIIISVLQYAMLIGVFLWMYKKMLPKTDNTDVVKEVPKITFDDVAGATELKNDLKYIIDYLKDSSGYHKVGAKCLRVLCFMALPVQVRR
jgi:cell division protease FtsH